MAPTKRRQAASSSEAPPREIYDTTIPDEDEQQQIIEAFIAQNIHARRSFRHAVGGFELIVGFAVLWLAAAQYRAPFEHTADLLQPLRGHMSPSAILGGLAIAACVCLSNSVPALRDRRLWVEPSLIASALPALSFGRRLLATDHLLWLHLLWLPFGALVRELNGTEEAVRVMSEIGVIARRT